MSGRNFGGLRYSPDRGFGENDQHKDRHDVLWSQCFRLQSERMAQLKIPSVQVGHCIWTNVPEVPS